MATLTRFTRPAEMVPTRSVIDHLLEGSFFAPSMMDRWANNPASATPANLVETNDSYVVQLAVPGISSEQLEIKSSRRDLQIKGVYETPAIENGNYIWQGLPSGEFTQAFTLPGETSSEGAEASYVNGVLTIRLPKSEGARVKTIPVKTTV
jgi:HSP20 family protein